MDVPTTDGSVKEATGDDRESTAKVRRRRWRRVPRSTLLACGVIAGLLLPQAGGAITPLFNDVPVSHPFFDQIQWMGNTGISNGYPDGSYRPNDPVTRQAMSAFMQRLYDVQDDMSWNTSGSFFGGFNEATWTDIPAATTTVSVPDGVYANITARFSAESICTGVASEWCSVRLVISKDGGPFNEMYPIVGTDYAFDHSDAAGTWESQIVERLAYGDPGATYTIKVQGQLEGATSFGVDDWSLVAETDVQPSDYIPF